MIEPKVIVASISEPITIEEVKLQCRIDSSDSTEDALLRIYIAAARNYVEWRTATTVHEATLEYVLDNFPGCRYIELPRATPLIEISSVKYKDYNGTETTWSSAEYVEDVDSTPGRLVLGYGQAWPSFTAYPVSPIRIRYTAGTAITTVPETEASVAVKYPMLLLVAGMYENRESENVTDRGVLTKLSIDYGVEAFLSRLTTQYVF